LKRNVILKEAPPSRYRRRRILLNETNHMRPDRRRRFYLAILFGFVFEQVFAIVVSSL